MGAPGGSGRLRMLTMLVFATVFGGMALLAFLVEHGFHFPALPPAAVTLAPAIVVAVTFAALGVSYGISQGIYGKKEF